MVETLLRAPRVAAVAVPGVRINSTVKELLRLEPSSARISSEALVSTLYTSMFSSP